MTAVPGTADPFTAPTLVEAAAILLAPLAGQLTHEAAHYVAAMALGAKPELNVRIRQVMTVTYDKQPLPDELLIGLAPTISGLVAALTWVGVFGWPAGTYFQIAVALAGVFHTLPSRVDLAGLRQYTGPEEPLSEGEEMVFKGLGALALASLVTMAPYNQGYVFSFLFLPLVAAGIVIIAMGAYRADSEQAP